MGPRFSAVRVPKLTGGGATLIGVAFAVAPILLDAAEKAVRKQVFKVRNRREVKAAQSGSEKRKADRSA